LYHEPARLDDGVDTWNQSAVGALAE